MVYGGTMQRDCSSCKLAGAQSEFNCGYIPENERTGQPEVIPDFGDINMKMDLCPVWYYLTDIHYYHFINIAKTIPIHQLSFSGRAVMESYTNYINLRNSKKK